MKTFSMEPGKEGRRLVDCPVCGADKHRKYWRSRNYSFVRCQACKLIYQNPQPVQNDLSDRYDEEYFEYERTNEEQFFFLMTLGLKDIDFESVSTGLEESKRSFLDIGCATGMLISHMNKSGWTVQGIEICRPAAEYGAQTRGVPIFIGSLDEARLADASFSVVHCSHLIEHLTDPLSFIREVYRVLAPGGFFVVTTPNSAGLQARTFGNRWRSTIADHVILYSLKTLRMLCVSNGFTVLRAKTWGGIAVGMAPGYIKRPLDAMAKKLGFGDVMIQLAQKSSTMPSTHPSILDRLIPRS